MQEKVKRTTIIDGNGEIRSETFEKMRTRWHEDKGFKLYHNQTVLNGFPEASIPKEANKTDLGNLFLLTRYLVGSSNMLGYRGNNNMVTELNMKRIANLLDIRERSAYRFIAKMVQLNLMGKVDVLAGDTKKVQYYMNPIYFSRGKFVNLNLYLLFKESIDPYLTAEAREYFGQHAKEEKE